jgi:hypothetical protein
VYCEKRFFRDHKQREGGVWVSVDKWKVNEYKILYPEDYEDEPEFEIDYDDRFYKSRDYFLFYILAGVRGNDSWGPRIADPKGIPDDCCPHIKNEIDRWDSDGHSHSYLTLKEILDFDWNAKVEMEDTVRQDDYESFIRKFPPEDILEETYRTIGEDNYRIYKIKYLIPYKDVFPKFMDTIARMNSLIEQRLNETQEDIRLVFFFDN